MMRSKNIVATPPGVTIKEQLVERGMSQKEFSNRMGMSEKHISRLINGEVQITTDMSIKLEMVLGIQASFWNNLEFIYREKLAKVEMENNMTEDIKISSKFPYKEMVKNKWIEHADKPEEKVINLRKFFEVSNLWLIKEELIPQIACRRQMITEKSDYYLIAWVQKAKLDARIRNVDAINIAGLKSELFKFRLMTRTDPKYFCEDLINTLAKNGIALIFLPHIGGSFLHGATFVDKNKIVIGLTVRGKDADKFWFSFFHEIAHIIFGHINQINGTTESDEQEADLFARDTLIPNDKITVFTKANDFSRKSIVSFAKDIGIDEGIVVGRLQKDGHIPYDRFNDLKKRYVIAK
jgi:HTH-type transcriptional regulator/antitoxin HigA